MSNRTGNKKIGILIQVLWCLYFIKCQLGRSERETRTLEPHIKGQESDRICVHVYIFVMTWKCSNFITTASVIIKLNMTIFRRTEIQLTVHYLTILNFFFHAIVWLKQSYLVQYHESVSEQLELNQPGGRHGQENRYHAKRKCLDRIKYFLMLGHRIEMIETW